MIALEPADVHVMLNPDCRLAPGIHRAIGRSDSSRTDDGSAPFRADCCASGTSRPTAVPCRSFRATSSTRPGMVAYRNRRVLDRIERPACRRSRPDRGATSSGRHGAAAVYRRAMLEDVAFGGEFLDEAFFAYREDVDLAWRAQLLGWRCRYVPAALARHRRRVAPGRRRRLPATINRLVRGQPLADDRQERARPQDGAATGRAIIARDIQILGFCALREQRSLLAVADVAGDATRTASPPPGLTMRRRRADDDDVLGWFGGPLGTPAPSQDVEPGVDPRPSGRPAR